jgi:fatty acid desaturase
MSRKPPTEKAMKRQIALFSVLAFMAAGLLAVPIIIAVLYAVAYVPVLVAIAIPIAYFTRNRWIPGLRERVNRWLATPELDAIRARADHRRSQERPAPPLAQRSASTAMLDRRADLRDATHTPEKLR